MGKYWQVLQVGIQNTLVYRVNFLFRATFALVPLTAMVMLWKTIYAGATGGRVGAYDLAQMISYYLLVTVTDALTAVTEDDWQIAADIKDGLISQFLLKPLDYLGYRLSLFVAGRLVYTAVAAVPVTLFILWHRQYFVLPPDWTTALCFFVSLVLTALLNFLTSFTMALLAFWVLEVATFIFILFAFEYLAGGHLFPLDILPAGLAGALMYTPFPYMLYFPISVYLGRTQQEALWGGLAMQALWVIAAYALARLVWARGIRRYGAVGG
ncbi:MAG: ABC-2 family transporter protein [Verrucomicrobiae bacterium]|nr:ABC-2 family transporter protein [Verrucomicrobiae bacterium]